MKKKKETILVFCAHSDDQIFGPGGTLAKYAKEGRDVYTVIFSFGEQSHPHIQEKITRRTRVLESKLADRIIGGKGVMFLGVKEGKFLEKERRTIEKIGIIISNKNPSKIFTHAEDDPQPDHRAVAALVSKVFDKMKLKCDLYAFTVWNPLKIRHRQFPKLVVDISGTFNKKIEALEAFKSQKIARLSLMWSVYAKAIMHGLKNKCRFAEVFWKVR